MEYFVFPDFDPVAIYLGPLAIRWYSLSYVVGLLLAWRYCLRLAQKPPHLVTTEQLDDFLTWAVLGVILGGRLGFVLFYQPAFYLANPGAILKVWQGGMAFHGGLAGVTLAMIIFARRRQIKLLALTDMIGAAAPLGLFLGRIANFINGELYGRVTDVPWAVIFRHAGDQPRHPSQLYEAALEGLVLFAVQAWMIFGPWKSLRRPGLTTGIFIGGYALARMSVEYFRQPDDYVGEGGFLFLGTTMGQWLSVPLLLGGAYLVWRAMRRPAEGK
ncbi:MAG: prolipoprotein diacylglyceryl transferase [Alphaproteobacteria bacterium]|nr:prolipoprotein diacylglyceryl transferase [Alphaproteobacteria bacterium]